MGDGLLSSKVCKSEPEQGKSNLLEVAQYDEPLFAKKSSLSGGENVSSCLSVGRGNVRVKEAAPVSHYLSVKSHECWDKGEKG